MPRFIEGQDRHQVTLLPESLDEFIADDNGVRVVDAFVDELDLAPLGFDGARPAETGRPGYHPAVLLKIYIYGYLNRVQSSRRLERECLRNVELMWLTGRLAPDFKTIADFRRENGSGIRNVCRRFVELCRELKLFSQAAVAIDGSKFKAVNARDRNFTPNKIKKRQEQIEESIKRYLDALDTADRTLSGAELQAKTEHLQDKLKTMRDHHLARSREKDDLAVDIEQRYFGHARTLPRRIGLKLDANLTFQEAAVAMHSAGTDFEHPLHHLQSAKHLVQAHACVTRTSVGDVPSGFRMTPETL